MVYTFSMALKTSLKRALSTLFPFFVHAGFIPLVTFLAFIGEITVFVLKELLTILIFLLFRILLVSCTLIGKITVDSTLTALHILRNIPRKSAPVRQFPKTVITSSRVILQDSILHILIPLSTTLHQTSNTLGRMVTYIPKRVHVKKKKTVLFSQKKRQKKYKEPQFFQFRFFFLGLVVAALVFIPLFLLSWFSQLPNPQVLAVREQPVTTKIFDRNGKLLYQIYAEQNRTPVDLSHIPPYLTEATIAIEDKNFYKHRGFDVEAIIRAGRETFLHQNIQGGSTITQQLIKSTLLSPERSYERKIKEVILAFWAEQLYTKDQILEMYFNEVSYGGTAWGVEAASQVYFGKDVKDLTLAQAALLAGLPAAPTDYSPFGAHPELAKQRQEEVLDRMVAEGYITQAQATDAKNEKLVFASPSIPIYAPHFVMYVKDELIKEYGIKMVEQGGLQVYTTLDLSLQQEAEKTVREEVDKLKPLQVGNGAMVITDPKTGEILAMVGSRDYFDIEHQGNVNVTTALRQPGSSIKPVTYATALEKGLTAATAIDDSPVAFPDGDNVYAPVNYDGRFHGRVTLRDALGNSLNIPAVKTLNQIGVRTMIAKAQQMGITTWDDENRFGLSLTLGGGEVRMIDMATVYSAFANDGKRNTTTPFIKIDNAKGETLFEHKPENTQVLNPGVAFIMSDILADANARLLEFGPNSVLSIANHRVSVKTGTTDNKRDNWTIGYTKDYVVTTWVGNNDNSPMNPALTSGITGAAPIWNRMMTYLLKDKKDDPVVVPSGVIGVPICSRMGVKTEYFLQGTQPSAQTQCKIEPTPTPSPH